MAQPIPITLDRFEDTKAVFTVDDSEDTFTLERWLLPGAREGDAYVIVAAPARTLRERARIKELKEGLGAK